MQVRGPAPRTQEEQQEARPGLRAPRQGWETSPPGADAHPTVTHAPGATSSQMHNHRRRERMLSGAPSSDLTVQLKGEREFSRPRLIRGSVRAHVPTSPSSQCPFSSTPQNGAHQRSPTPHLLRNHTTQAPGDPARRSPRTTRRQCPADRATTWQL